MFMGHNALDSLQLKKINVHVLHAVKLNHHETPLECILYGYQYRPTFFH